MLIYCSHLWIRPERHSLELEAPIACWLSEKVRTKVEPEALVDGFSQSYSTGFAIEVSATEAEHGRISAVRLRHRDSVVPGRDWLTDVGMRRGEEGIFCSVTLATQETSRFVPAVGETTRPRVVGMIADGATLDSRTVGGRPGLLTIEDADAFEYRVKDADREFPILVISCDRAGNPLVEPNRMASLLLGLAEVVVIPPTVDTYRLEDVLGEQYSAYGGAITLIWRRARYGGRDLVPSTKLIPEHLLELKARSPSLEAEILAKVCHRTNASLSRRAITIDDVKRLASQSQLARALAAGSSNSAELTALCHTVDVEQRQKISELENEVARKDEEIGQLRDDLDELARANEALKAHLGAAATTRPSAGTNVTNTELLLNAMTDDITLERCLDVIAELFPDRVVILRSARTSARESVEFQQPRRALELLAKLCGPFWTLLSQGKGTNDAKDVLGAAYAANESKSARNNKRAIELRTFVYEGQPVEMMQHLRIGVKEDSLAETWRCHFHWDAERRRIVIGHCGRHLDHR